MVKTYKGQFITRTDSGIDSLYGSQRPEIAYVDAASTSGLYSPSCADKRHIKPGRRSICDEA